MVSTGALYEEAVRAMSTYRSMAARMQNARAKTQGRLDGRMILLSERIGEMLGQLTDMERSALSCWRDGIMPNTYRVDHDAIKAKPYVSIRRVERSFDTHETYEDAIEEVNASQLALGSAHWQRLRQIVKRTNG